MPQQATDEVRIPHNPRLVGLARLIRDITYKDVPDCRLNMDILQPQFPEHGNCRYPAVLFIQGSAFRTPDRDYEIPQLSLLAQRGFVVATINHRDATKGYPYPAYLEDTKAALRYLRAHSEEFCIDPQRIGVWGTSSGGNTAMMLGVTIGDDRYDDGSNSDWNDCVDYVVSCFGPADMLSFLDAPEINDPDSSSAISAVLGVDDLAKADRDERTSAASLMSPIRRLESGGDYPPFLLLHGDRDSLVPFSQSQAMHARLKELGVEANLIRVEGAGHEGDFWSQRVLNVIFDFIEQHA